ncbi:hypothetical protein, partial [Limnohabitans sp. Rim28]|uniref:hypothetical protein n=1 Tax=Limnohabitans sp. Rim28 TaxID=1100720 RepID=UPI000D522265
ALADAVQAVAGYGTGTPPTDAQINALLGTSTVTADNLAAVLAAIKAGNADGSAINGIGGAGNLSEVVGNAITAFDAAITKIANYADDNGATNSVPQASDYSAVGVTGIGGGSQPTVSMINSALATTALLRTNADSAADVQAIVNAYQVILNNANTASSTDASASDYLAIGVTGVDAGAETSLLG